MTIIVAAGHVHADLDDGRADQDVELAVAEAAHLGVAVGGLHPAVDQADPERGEQRAQADRLALGGDGALGLVAGALLDQRHDDERPVAERPPPSRTFAQVPSRSSGRRMPGPDRHAAGGRRAQVRDVEVGVEHLAERPRDRRRGHQQHVRRAAAGLGLELRRAGRRRTGAARR